jgi:PAS domain S-box-containing protein
MEPTTNQNRILVIEDNPGDFALVEDFLTEKIEQLELLHVKSFNEAKTILSARQFDVVLLDLSLPDKTGAPLIKGIVEFCSGAPVIVLTGYSDFEFGIRSLSIGVSDYLLKEELTPTSLHKSILYSRERKKVITDLEVSEHKYSELFHLSPQPMWVFDIDTLRFLNVNNAAVNQYGYSLDEFLLMKIKDIRPANETIVIESIIDKCPDKDRLVFKGIFRHKKRTGEIIMVDIQSNIIEYKGRTAAVILAIDVTERLNYVRAIELQNEKFREISWIQSHIVRAPLARIMGLAHILIDLKDDEEKDETLRHLLISANELDMVIREITDKTKTSGDDRQCEINELLHCIKCA